MANKILFYLIIFLSIGLVACKEIKKPALIEDKFFTIPLSTLDDRMPSEVKTNMLISDDEIVYLSKDTIDNILVFQSYFFPPNKYTIYRKFEDTSYYDYSVDFIKPEENILFNDSMFKTLQYSNQYLIYVKKIKKKYLCSFIFWNCVQNYSHTSYKFFKNNPEIRSDIKFNINEYTPNIVTNLDSATIHRLYPQFKGKIIKSDYVKSIYMDPRNGFNVNEFYLSIEFRLKNGDTLKYRESPNMKKYREESF